MKKHPAYETTRSGSQFPLAVRNPGGCPVYCIIKPSMRIKKVKKRLDIHPAMREDCRND